MLTAARPRPTRLRPPHARRAGAGAVVAVLTLLLAACARTPSGSDGLDAVAVEGDVGSKPTVTFDAPLSLQESQSRVLVEGEGEDLTAEDSASLQLLVINGRDGSQVDSSYDRSPETVSLSSQGGLEYVLTSLAGTPVGSRVLFAVAPQDGLLTDPSASAQAAADPSAPFTAEDTLVLVVDVLGVVPTTADGEPVVGGLENLPTVQTDADNKVTGITVTGGPPPTDLVVQPLLQGDGAEVTADDTLTVQYEGALWDGGTTFDSSWQRGSPATFALDQVIPGWTQGLTGQKVGSRVLLIVPPALGYGEAGSPPSIPANATLVFVVDILAVS